MKHFEPTSSVLKPKPKLVIPYAKELEANAELIVNETKGDIAGGKVSGIEAAGKYALASLLASIAAGDIPAKSAFTILKSFAEKKTQNPVQKIEQHQTVDIRAILFDAIAENSHALERTVAVSIASRERVRERLGASSTALDLTGASDSGASDAPEAEKATEVDFREASSLHPAPITDWTPGESPDEIKQLGGDRE